MPTLTLIAMVVLHGLVYEYNWDILRVPIIAIKYIYPSPHYKKSFLSSYQRRRERRAAERENREHAEEAFNHATLKL